MNLSAGSLGVGSIDTTGNPSRFNWTGGTLNVTGSGGVFLGAAGPFGNALSVNNGKALLVTNLLSVVPGAVLNLGANGTLITNTLDLGGDPSRLNWSGGQLRLTTTGLTVLDLNTALGPSLAVPSWWPWPSRARPAGSSARRAPPR